MAKSKPLKKMAPLLGKPKEFLKIPKPTKDLNLRSFFYLERKYPMLTNQDLINIQQFNTNTQTVEILKCLFN
ncbi:MAG: hypothetical protein U9532_03455, partial ['Conium maculatum' witches'-broom phytoplasma]|nr:hypothetical protein ['Conium maculatum' witches'-broom phytoplasma]